MAQWKWYIYIIECLDKSYYTGLTWSPNNRWEQHQSGLGAKYTKMHGAGQMVYIEAHNSFETARYREHQIKDWSRLKKKKLINGQWSKDWS